MLSIVSIKREKKVSLIMNHHQILYMNRHRLRFHVYVEMNPCLFSYKMLLKLMIPICKSLNTRKTSFQECLQNIKLFIILAVGTLNVCNYNTGRV